MKTIANSEQRSEKGSGEPRSTAPEVTYFSSILFSEIGMGFKELVSEEEEMMADFAMFASMAEGHELPDALNFGSVNELNR